MRQFLALTLFISLYCAAAANECKPVGDLNVFVDPQCPSSGPGCNAGGQGPTCRFCGFDVFPPCPSATSATKPTSAQPPRSTTSRSTFTTTKRATVSTSRKPNPATGSPQPEPEAEYNQYGEKLIFSDDFDTFDMKTWKHDLTMSGGGNWEFQIYHNNRTNSFVKDGNLHIHPTLTEDRIGFAGLSSTRLEMWGGSPVDQCTGNNFYGCERTGGAGGGILNPIQSAKLTTVNSFSFKYGRVEVRAKLPRGDWLWPAIWMLPATNPYGMWPASGEIDIMEGRGNVNYDDPEGGLDHFGSTLHWGVDWTQNRYRLTHEVYKNEDLLSNDFHTYGLMWTAERLYTYIDDPENIVLDVDLTKQSFYERGGFSENWDNPWQYSENQNAAPFDEEFYLIINLAVGGVAGYFQDGVSNKPWSDRGGLAANDFYRAKDQWYPTWQNPDVDLVIDSVKVWQ